MLLAGRAAVFAEPKHGGGGLGAFPGAERHREAGASCRRAWRPPIALRRGALAESTLPKGHSPKLHEFALNVLITSELVEFRGVSGSAGRNAPNKGDSRQFRAESSPIRLAPPASGAFQGDFICSLLDMKRQDRTARDDVRRHHEKHAASPHAWRGLVARPEAPRIEGRRGQCLGLQCVAFFDA